MFTTPAKKLLSATAAAFIGIALSLVAVDAPAFAVAAPSGSTSTSASSSASATTTDKESVPADAVCIPKSAVSFTYYRSTNSGVITVQDVANSTGVLCDPFSVTAVSWKYSSSCVVNTSDCDAMVPQTLETYNTLYVSKPGSYDYGSQLTCGQGDIFATFGDTPLIPLPRIPDLHSASTTGGVFGFLNWLGFTWTNPTFHDTWVQQSTTCRTPGDPSVSPEVCTDGSVSKGSITVDLRKNLIYSIKGTDNAVDIPVVSSAVTPLSAGSYLVSVKAADGWGLTGATAWPYTLKVLPAADCGGLTTLSEQPVNVSSTQAVCISNGNSAGTITVGQLDGVDFTPYVQYSIDGTPVSAITTSVAAGSHVVTAVALGDNTLDPTSTALQPDGTAKWTVAVAAATTACGDLKTLAITGGPDDRGGMLLALVLLQLGVALLAVRYVMLRRPNGVHRAI